MTDLHVNVKNSSTLVFVSVAKWAVQILQSSDVKRFFEVSSHNINFCAVDCAFFVHCLFIAEKSSKIFLAGLRKVNNLTSWNSKLWKLAGISFSDWKIQNSVRRFLSSKSKELQTVGSWKIFQIFYSKSDSITLISEGLIEKFSEWKISGLDK